VRPEGRRQGRGMKAGRPKGRKGVREGERAKALILQLSRRPFSLNHWQTTLSASRFPQDWTCPSLEFPLSESGIFVYLTFPIAAENRH